jgi:cephalosporin hydroxylase
MIAWKETKGWFSEEDALEYNKLIERIPVRGTLIEVGSFAGKSLLSIADTLNTKDIKVIAIDIWDKWPECPPGMDTSIEEFRANTKCIKNLETLKMTSKEASIILNNRGMKADGIFLDATHTYEGILKDINIWTPLVCPTGWIAGHDFHPSWAGVPKAVTEKFGSNYTVHGTVWSRGKQ